MDDKHRCTAAHVYLTYACGQGLQFPLSSSHPHPGLHKIIHWDQGENINMYLYLFLMEK